MADEEHKSEIETGFGTGLRAKLGRGDDEAGSPAPTAAPDGEGFVHVATAGPNGDVEALRAELAAALERERDLRTDLAQSVVPVADFSADTAELKTRGADLDARAARLAAVETE